MNFFNDITEFIEKKILYNKLLGIKLNSLTNGSSELYLPFKKELLGDPFRSIIHGGVISSLIDVSGGVTCFSILRNPSYRLSTLDLRVDFLEPVKNANLICSGKIVRIGNKIGVARMDVFVNNNSKSKLVAIGNGVYTIIRQL
jgi:uncharacterized protein (TIGR00369 family)